MLFYVMLCGVCVVTIIYPILFVLSSNCGNFVITGSRTTRTNLVPSQIRHRFAEIPISRLENLHLVNGGIGIDGEDVDGRRGLLFRDHWSETHVNLGNRY
jgi:hypothetical protein